MTDRIALFDRDGAPLGDLRPQDLLSAPRMAEEVGGEHTLTVETTSPLADGTRLLWRDGTGEWREWVVSEPEERHGAGTYLCTWSLQHDLEAVAGGTHWASAAWGTHEPTTARAALELAISDQGRWAVGDVDVQTLAAASLYDGQAWDYVKRVCEVWGGELSATIEVGPTGVTARRVNLLARLGSDAVTRRFDWGCDVTGITRAPPPAPHFCRVRPRGGSARTDADGVDYTARVGIEGVTPGGEDYIEDPEAALAFRTRNPDGTWEYPTKTVIYDVTETSTGPDDEELYATALADLHRHTRPVPTYEADVLQYARAGLDYRGIALGDSVHVVDRGFAPDVALRLEGRVLRVERDLPVLGDGGECALTIGSLAPTLADAMRSAARATADLEGRVREVQGGGSIVYLDGLLDAVNAQMNTVGAWKYEVAGKGTYVYDRAVADPPTGTGATRCVHVGGGCLRFADSRTGAGDWDWKNVITSEGYIGLAATVGRLTAGRIGSAGQDTSWWDLDNGVLHIGSRTDREVMDDIAGAARTATDFLRFENGELVLGATDGAVRNVMTSTRTAFRTDAGDVAHFGLDVDGMWRLYIENAQITDMLRFGDFAWIARANGNMTLKWIGEA